MKAYYLEDIKQINTLGDQILSKIIDILEYNNINNLYIVHDLFTHDATIEKLNSEYILKTNNINVIFNLEYIKTNIDIKKAFNYISNLLVYLNSNISIKQPIKIYTYKGENIVGEWDAIQIINKYDIKKNINLLAKELKNNINHSLNNKVTIKDIELLINCYMNDNFEPMQDTKLYNNLGGVYCLYLELLNNNYSVLNSCMVGRVVLKK